MLRYECMGGVGPIDILADPDWIRFNGPGVYMFHHEAHGYLYIGLAKSMFKRLWDYRVRDPHYGDYKAPANSRAALLCIPTPKMVSLRVYFCTDYAEARKLEAKLIRQHRPKFNVLMKGV